jgi:CheY-like chemotaxis protein
VSYPVASNTAPPLVVVVDDEPALRHSMTAALETDFRILTAENGTAALELFVRTQLTIAAVVTDIRMPGMGGLALATALRHHGVQVPILFVSGYADNSEVPGPVLPKPFTPEGLLVAVRELVLATRKVPRGRRAYPSDRPLPARPMSTVLIVDDEAPVRQFITRILRHSGYETLEAVDGRDAWTQLQRGAVRIDAVLTDVVMPIMTGTELLALVLANRPELPIALMSGYSVDALQSWGLEDPPVPLLTKPFTPEQLVALMTRLLPRGFRSAAPPA